MRNIILVDCSSSSMGILNKDVNSGLGTRTRVGEGIRAKLLERTKKNGIQLPLLEIAYVSALLNQQNHSVTYKKITGSSDIRNLNRLIEYEDVDDLLFFPSMISYKEDLELANTIRKSYPSVKLGVLGVFAGIRPDLFENEFHWVALGESEALLLKYSIDDLKGRMGPEPFLEDLDQLPFPDWSVFSEKKFSYRPILPKTPFFTMLGSRGCPMACGYYCPYPMAQGKKYRMRSIESLLAEITHLKETYNAKSVLFRDPYFSLDKQRTLLFAKEMINREINIQWACETRLDSLDEEELKLLYTSGLRSINIGIESSDPEILHKIKRHSLEQMRERKLIDYCYHLGIKINAFFIFGLIPDTRDSILATIEYAKSLKTFSSQFTINTPLPGTSFYNDMSQLINQDISLEDYDNNTLVFSHKNLSEEDVYSLKEKAFLEYYFSPKLILRYIRWTLRDLFL